MPSDRAVALEFHRRIQEAEDQGFEHVRLPRIEAAALYRLLASLGDENARLKAALQVAAEIKPRSTD